MLRLLFVFYVLRSIIKHMRKVVSVLTILTALLIFTPRAIAEVKMEETLVSVSEDEVIDDDLYLGAETANVKGTINGDLYIGGGSVTVDATVNGDIIAGGGTVTISGTIEDDVRVAGGTVVINDAQIGDSLMVFGGTVSVDNDSVINGGVVFSGGSVTLDAPVARGILGAGGTIHIDNTVGRDVNVAGGTITFGSNANVAGTVYYASESNLNVDENAVIGATEAVTMAEHARDSVDEGFGAAKYGFKVWSFLSTLLVGLVLLWLFPRFMSGVVGTMEQNLGSSLLWGVLVLLLTVPVALLLMVTVIGLPLAAVMLGVFGLLLFLSKVFAGYFLGSWIVKNMDWEITNKYLVFAIGLLVFVLLTIVPILGGFVWLFGALLTLGAVFMVYRAYRTTLVTQ